VFDVTVMLVYTVYMQVIWELLVFSRVCYRFYKDVTGA